jgi:phenylalanyl-tRNA synthetase alpha chain
VCPAYRRGHVYDRLYEPLAAEQPWGRAGLPLARRGAVGRGCLYPCPGRHHLEFHVTALIPTPVPRLISTRDLVAALEVRDLTDPAQGRHAVQLLLDEVVGALSSGWGCAVDVRRRHPLVAVRDNYDRLGYAAGDVTRDSRYSRYVAETVMLRSHTSAGVPPVLRSLAREARDDEVLLVLPGLCYRRDSIDRLHVGTPHQVDLWRIAPSPLTEDDLEQMVGLVVGAVLPGAAWRTVPARHPYTQHGRQIDVRTEQGWVELAECGLALGMGLDRAVLLRKDLPDIRLLRSEDPRVAAQLRDLQPWRPVSSHPAVRRDLSVVVDAETDGELLGDAVRQALGADADDLEA